MSEANHRIITVALSTAIFLLCFQTAFAQARESFSSHNQSYEVRRSECLDFLSTNGTQKGLYGVFRQLARAASGKTLEYSNMDEVVRVLKSNRDCTDFTMNGCLRLLYLYKSGSILPEKYRRQLTERVLDFKYWIDDMRNDTVYRCYHTENHQGLYHTAELLAGQLFKNSRFSDGRNGYSHVKHASPMLEKWLDDKFLFGFCEWMSTYYDEDILALSNIYDFSEDKDLKRKAGNVLTLLLFDISLNSFHGYLGSSAGRTYAHSLLTGTHNTSPVTRLLFGQGNFDRPEVMGAVALATSTYSCPEVIKEIANDGQTMLGKQRVSFNLEDAGKFGKGYKNEEDAFLYWQMGEFYHPMSINLEDSISKRYNMWPANHLDRYMALYDKEKRNYGRVISTNLSPFVLSEANIETYRTRDFMLSTAVDYRKGNPGYQQLVWAATLSPRAIVYTTCPGSTDMKKSPNYWSGNIVLPKAVQYRNVTICIYNTTKEVNNGLTHAYFPTESFDQWCQVDHWSFARVGNGYLAIYSKIKPSLEKDFRGIKCDLKANGDHNIWICEMGSKETSGSFRNFIKKIKESRFYLDNGVITYRSPSCGVLKTSWNGELRINGIQTSTRWEYRYDNPYCKALYGTDRIEIISKKGHLILTK